MWPCRSAAGEDRNLYMNHLPRLEGGQSANYVKPSMFFSITSQAKEPEAAAMFIDFFTNDVEANEILFAERGVPVSSEIRDALKPELGKAQLEMFEFLDRVVADSSPIRPPDPVGHADIINNIYWPEAIDPVLYGQMDSAEAVAEFARAGVSRFWRRMLNRLIGSHLQFFGTACVPERSQMLTDLVTRSVSIPFRYKISQLCWRSRRRAMRKDNFAGYFMISPWLISFFAFTLIPIIVSFYLAFTDYDILSPPNWVGTENFVRMFTGDARYIRSVKATFRYVFLAVPLRLMFALFVAMLLNTKRRGVSGYRAAYYAPSIVGGSVAVAVMWREIFGTNGLINAIFGTDVAWLGNPDTAIWTLILLAAWQFGSPMLIFLAGLKQIPSELYEAAAIDGANGWHRFWRVTLPLLTPDHLLQPDHADHQRFYGFHPSIHHHRRRAA